jgi:GTP pyrophosphokinase
MALFADEVYVFTPKGDVKAFPKGATPIDFAYSIHTDVGNQCIGAKVNRNIVPLKYELQNGDTVEVITQAGHHPSKDWLKYAVTSRAISKIRNWVKTEERKKSVALGKDLLEKEFKRHNLKLSQIVKSEEIKKIYTEYSVNSLDDLMAIVGYGKVSAKRIVKQFVPEEEAGTAETALITEEKKKKFPSSVGISLTGIEDILVRFARCCNPIPGDEIAGYISRGRGVTVHTANCPNVEGMDGERIVDVQWNIKEKQTYPVHMRVVCRDKKGLLAEVSTVIASLDINISHAEVETRPADMQAILSFELDVNDLQQFNQVLAAIKKLKSVISVERVRTS